MDSRTTSFGEKKLSKLDILIAWLRYRKIFQVSKKYGITFGGKSICDVGCGYNGDLLEHIRTHENPWNLYGVDLSPNKDNEHIHMVEANLEKDRFELTDNSVDIVLSLAVIEHLNSPENYLSEIYRIMSPGGYAVLTTPSTYGKPVLETLAALRLIAKEEIDDHKIYYNKKTLTEVLSKYFDTVNVEYFQFWLNTVAVVSKKS